MHTILKDCENCNELEAIYNKIECTLLYLARNKDASLKYNVDVYFNQDLFNDLMRYKRIIGKRLTGCSYPCSSIKTSDIIAKAAFLVFRDANCSQCEDCFPEQTTETPTTSSTTTTSNTP